MVEFDDRLFWIENLENLLLVGLRVLRDFFARKLLACLGFSGWIADHASEITDEKDHFMTQLLKLLHLLDEHGMSEMKIRRRGIEPRLDSKRTASFELGGELFFRQHLDGAALNYAELGLQIGHFQRSACQGILSRRISWALPLWPSTSTIMPCRTTLSVATSNWRGSWEIKPRMTVSLSMPITESNAPHMPTSVMSAVTPGRILSSAVCT